ncbi:uncharacterized protein LAESUDRAFT_703856 [Laetiporus sulphureus 93-53]|uniref:Uncharacterized protein n=1 Tax=Laetiporus sulphureus 93-53 TaxID=1314785 RepID=A0A165D0H5_9APHY|nr:uncharacterized protein LAESUDRAFT_703856 [Laetiporus sulphureus 93-53]KZT03888.1 hypothetical protein LAESUDRAFT_703856 [Laetiporus sulphureus 93-53]
MPKRIPTPPPPDDEPRFLTVHYPYPLHANVEHMGDRLAFVYWISSIIGAKSFYAFYYRPRTAHNVLIEIDRSYKGVERLLGEHRWAEFLRNPSDTEKQQVSKIFYCTHSSGREVQKYGWKRLDVLEEWFEEEKWIPINKLIVHPYPATYYCEVPKEDKTREPLCRHLPVRVFPPPPPEVPPKVGTPEWITWREQKKLYDQLLGRRSDRRKAEATEWTWDDPTLPSKEPEGGEHEVSLGVSNIGDWAQSPAAAAMQAPPGLGPARRNVRYYQEPPPVQYNTSGKSSIHSSSSNGCDNSDPLFTPGGPQNDHAVVLNVQDAMQSLSVDDDLYDMEDDAPAVQGWWAKDNSPSGAAPPVDLEEKDGDAGAMTNLWESMPKQPESSLPECSLHILKYSKVCRECEPLIKLKRKLEEAGNEDSTFSSRPYEKAKGEGQRQRRKNSSSAPDWRAKSNKGRAPPTAAANVPPKPSRLLNKAKATPASNGASTSNKKDGDASEPTSASDSESISDPCTPPPPRGTSRRPQPPSQPKRVIPPRPARLERKGTRANANSTNVGEAATEEAPKAIPPRPARLTRNKAPAATVEAPVAVEEPPKAIPPRPARLMKNKGPTTPAPPETEWDAKSEASSLWPEPDNEDPWGSVPPLPAGSGRKGSNKKGKGGRKTWADEVEEEEARIFAQAAL